MFENIQNTFTKNKIETTHHHPLTKSEDTIKELESLLGSAILHQNEKDFKEFYGLSKNEFREKLGFDPDDELAIRDKLFRIKEVYATQRLQELNTIERDKVEKKRNAELMQEAFPLSKKG